MPPRAIASQSFTTALGTWTHSSAEPLAPLRGVVAELWEVEGRLMPFVERILPSGFVELMINLGPVHSVIGPEGTRRYEDAWFSGLHQGSITIESLEGTHLVSARIYPEHAERLLPGAARSHDRVVDLDALVGDAAHALRAAVGAAATPAARFDTIERWLEGRLAEALPGDRRVEDAMRTIRESHGAARITDLAAAAGVTRKHLGALFVSRVGLPPKAVSRIGRFAWVLQQLRASETVDWSDLAQQAGYSDQAHLIRDFQRIAGASPMTFLRVRTADSRAVLVDP